MLTAIFIHLDDNSSDIRDAIFISLKHAAAFDTKKVLETAQQKSSKMKYSSCGEELIMYCL